MPKPRSNQEACAYWADGILTREAQPHIEVNSIKVRGDIVYSFGTHFPMGIIVRAESGRCTKVIITSDRWGAGGFANTNGDIWTCKSEAQARVEGTRIKLVELPLTDHNTGPIRCVPRADDPEPERYWRTEVPTYFYASDPGPEPVKSDEGCIAGTREEYEAQTDSYVCANLDLYADDQEYVTAFGTYHARDLTPGAWLYRKDGGSIYTRQMENHATVWGEEKSDWQHFNNRHEPIPRNVTYKQCPHCATFDAIHERWSLRYHGKPWGRGSGRGYKLHSEMMARFGSEEGWREGRKADWARVKAGRQAWQEWFDRNHIPHSAITAKRAPNGPYVPVMTNDGHATRKDQEAYFRRQRQAERDQRRVKRMLEAELRRRRQVERFIARARLAQKPKFETVASHLAGELVQMNMTLRTNDSQEVE